MKVIDEFEAKMALFPNPKNKTIQRVLITNDGLDKNLQHRAYFDRVIRLEDLFEDRIWK